jgi:multiple sugar transport system ATP-binding protein
MAEIRIEAVTKAFGSKVAVRNADLVIADREFLVLLGPSGCGKTTLLRAIAGLGMADSGRITIGGRDVTYLPPGKRNLSMVFQSYAIFPHMTVGDNIGFGLKMQGTDRSEQDRRVAEAAEMLHIEDLLDRRPGEMSGGQRQRVAVARALAMRAEVVLMDEPLSNLDALLRLEMRAELKKLLADIGATTVYVTHDQIEALSMGDRVAVMRDGELQQIDRPQRVYEEPVNRFVGGFIGNPPMNFIEGSVRRVDGGVEVDVGGHRIDPGSGLGPRLSELDGDRVVVGIRAENIVTVPETGSDPGAPRTAPEAAPANTVVASVEVVEPLGSQNLLTVDLAGQRLKVSTHPSVAVSPQDRLQLQLPAHQIRWIDPTTERALHG